MNRNSFLTMLFCALLWQPLMAQQKQVTGNVVAYFGKERNNMISEGQVIDRITRAYALPISVQPGYLFATKDELAWQIFSGKLTQPIQSNTQLIWQALEADTAYKFKNTSLRRSYLYTDYLHHKEEILLLEASGGTRTFINGLPHEGDHYDFAYTLIPFKAKKGNNQFIFTPGRFGQIEIKIIKARKPVMLTNRDLTVADIIIGEDSEKWGAVRVINASNIPLSKLTIKCELENGANATFATSDVLDLTVRKLPFKIPATNTAIEGKIKAVLTLLDMKGNELDQLYFELEQRHATSIHERTFRSRIDNSVQYYSINPSTSKENLQPLFLSVHGASVEARNQARAYASKPWGHIVAPTNRRPFGFNWEEWGRIDALEVFEDAKKLLKTHPQLSYLTGHSMGGHGTWFLGATYPDKFAAIAPCAGYPDISEYSRLNADSMNYAFPIFDIIKRAANGGRSKELKRNYLQSGVYILHGDADQVVPVTQARGMRKLLADFHPDFSYYEYPGGSHWYSNESVDWKPIFDYFKWHSIPEKKSVKHIEFHTASPAISATNYWLTVEQQDQAYQFSEITLNLINDSIKGISKNIAALSINCADMEVLAQQIVVQLDSSTLVIDNNKKTTLIKTAGQWKVGNLDPNHKNPNRYGGFKQVFDNNVVLVYATLGSKDENEWYKNKAKFDAETFLYRGNGSIDIVSDIAYISGNFTDRNVVIYGNARNNAAWKKLLYKSPIQVNATEIKYGDSIIKGNDLGTYFIQAHPDSYGSLVGVVAGTGLLGAKATYPNDYISGITGYPDYLIFDINVLKDGISGVKKAGFFQNNWSLKNEN